MKGIISMNLRVAVRLLLGVAFGYLGYRVSREIINFQDPNLVETISIVIGLLLGSVGVYLIPAISKWVQDFTRFFTQDCRGSHFSASSSQNAFSWTRREKNRLRQEMAKPDAYRYLSFDRRPNR